MSLGVPVVASERGSLPEVLGGAGLVVDPIDRPTLRKRLSRAWWARMVLPNRAPRKASSERARFAGNRRPIGCTDVYQAAIARERGRAADPSMRIGIDAAELCGRSTGVGATSAACWPSGRSIPPRTHEFLL